MTVKTVKEMFEDVADDLVEASKGKITKAQLESIFYLGVISVLATVKDTVDHDQEKRVRQLFFEASARIYARADELEAEND